MRHQKIQTPFLFFLAIIVRIEARQHRRDFRMTASYSTSAAAAITETILDSLQDIIGADEGDRGMKALIVPGDLRKACEIFGQLPVVEGSNVLILSGFPCHVTETPPSETDGPPGTAALAQAAQALGHSVTVVVDACNEEVFAAALEPLMASSSLSCRVSLRTFSPQLPGTTYNPEEKEQLEKLATNCRLIISCERAGPAADGICYTMRGTDMTTSGLIAPLHLLVERRKVPFLAIGDGGNELGMGKVIKKIVNNPKIANGDKIGCVVAADHLVAASISNWGGYAMAAGAAVARAQQEHERYSSAPVGSPNHASFSDRIRYWVQKCLPTEKEEISLLDRCVVAGARDGMSGKLEATVDGQPLQLSLQCLRGIHEATIIQWE